MSTNYEVALFWGRLSYIGVVFISPGIYALSVAYLNFQHQKKFVIAAFIVCSIFCILSQTSWFVSSVRKYYWGYHPIANFLHPPFLLLFFSLMIAGLSNLYQGYKSETLPIEKQRRKYLFLAFLIAYFGSWDYFPNYGVEVYPFGFIFVFLLFSIVAYIIIKFRLMDVETFIHKIIVYTFLSFVVLLVYGGVMILAQVFLEGGAVNIKDMTITAFFMTGILFFVSHLKNKTQAFVDKVFYKDKYDYRKTLTKFVKRLSFYLDSPVLLQTITGAIAEIIHVDKVALLLFNAKSGHYTIRKSLGLSDTSKVLNKDNPFAIFLESYDNIVEREFLIMEPRFENVRAEGLKIMKVLEAELIIPLIVQQKLIGILAIGKKLSGEVYKFEDIELLSSAGQEIAVAISNYLLYERLEKTNCELREAQTQLVQSAKMAAVGQLGAGVAHELNNPLGGILGYSQFVLGKLNRPSFGADDFQSCRGYIESIERESIRCKKIISNLLRFSRKPAIDQFESMNVGASLEEMITLMSHQLKLCNVNVIVRLQPDLAPVMGVDNLLQQVFTNFILNAQQAMPAGGQLSIVAENVPDEQTWVKIDFIDTGCGISQENLNRIFEPFFTTKTEKGTGLGLFVSYQIIHEHKGRIQVKSEVGKGTTFTLILPAAIAGQ